MNIFVYSIAHTTHMRNTCTNYFHALTHMYQNIAYIYLLLKIQTYNLRLKHWGIETTNCTIRYNIYPLVQLVLTFIHLTFYLFSNFSCCVFTILCSCAVGIGIYSIRFHKIIFLILYKSTLHAHIGKENYLVVLTGRFLQRWKYNIHPLLETINSKYSTVKIYCTKFA